MEPKIPDVLFEKRLNGVALITLDRPESLNAMGGGLMEILANYLEECDRDHDVRCVAVTGAGRAFCAGGDVRGMQQRNSSGDGTGAPQDRGIVSGLESAVRGLRRSQDEVSLQLHTMGKPTVAIVNGHAVGAGMSVALAADIRLCSESAKFGTAFRNVGLSGDYGGSYFLQRLIGLGRARELYFTAEILDAKRALELGIAQRRLPRRLVYG